MDKDDRSETTLAQSVAPTPRGGIRFMMNSVGSSETILSESIFTPKSKEERIAAVQQALADANDRFNSAQKIRDVEHDAATAALAVELGRMEGGLIYVPASGDGPIQYVCPKPFLGSRKTRRALGKILGATRVVDPDDEAALVDVHERRLDYEALNGPWYERSWPW